MNKMQTRRPRLEPMEPADARLLQKPVRPSSHRALTALPPGVLGGRSLLAGVALPHSQLLDTKWLRCWETLLMNAILKIAALALLIPAAAASFAQATASPAPTDYFANWPAGSAPQDVGKRLAEHFVTSPHQGNKSIFYGECATWYGALTVAQLTHDDALRQRLIDKFNPIMPGGAEAGLIPVRRHVDDSIFGIIPLEIGIQTKGQKYLAYGQWWADRQWENPQPDGLSAETRYWIDDMYMLTILQLEAWRATGDCKYLDRDALEMVSYLEKLQQPNGLFYHAADVPFFWGRGDGWVAAGMAEMLPRPQ